jgi:hypothetical protein
MAINSLTKYLPTLSIFYTLRSLRFLYKEIKMKKERKLLFKWIPYLLAPLTCLFMTSAGKYDCPPYEVKALKSIESLGKQIARKYEMCLLYFGNGQEVVGSRECTWSLNLMSRKKMTIEEARPLAVEIARGLLSQLYGNPAFQYALTKSSDKYKWLPSKPADNQVGFRLGFWDENTCRPLKPYLAQIRFVDGQLYYHYADPKTQALLDPIIESVEPLEPVQSV